jgi:all-trans-retinol 13,14-reductase
VILNHTEVTEIVEEHGTIKHVTLNGGGKIYGKHFISNVHPARTLSMTRTNILRKVYRERINNLENTCSSFCVFIRLKPDALPYFKHNFYLHRRDGVWEGINCEPDDWPRTCAVIFSPSLRTSMYAESVTLLSYMKYTEVEPWCHTFNIDSKKQYRGEDYEAFKTKKAEKLLDLAEQYFPGLRSYISSYYTSSPLSYRDYIGNADG